MRDYFSTVLSSAEVVGFGVGHGLIFLHHTSGEQCITLDQLPDFISILHDRSV
jgi:hypothetical protein